MSRGQSFPYTCPKCVALTQASFVGYAGLMMYRHISPEGEDCGEECPLFEKTLVEIKPYDAPLSSSVFDIDFKYGSGNGGK